MVILELGALVWNCVIQRVMPRPKTEHLLREMAQHEDQVVQNHMISIVLVKPSGILRAIVLRAGLWTLGSGCPCCRDQTDIWEACARFISPIGPS